jgi:outer membrane protein assembly factor BamD (BamD/ComL family)
MLARNASFSRTLILIGGAWLAASAIGCDWTMPWQKKPAVYPDGVVLRGQTRPDYDTSPAIVSGSLAHAREMYRQSDYEHAEKGFHEIAEDQKNSPLIAEEARFNEAECLRARGKMPMACDTYSKMLKDFPSGAYKDQAVRRMYDIAVVWLKPTEKEFAERAQNKTIIVPAVLQINVDKSMPTIDAEGRALQALETVYYSDITGPLAAPSLYLSGYIMYVRENYKEADFYFTQLLEMHKDSPHASKAAELDIICKSLATGGPDYDGRKNVEARQLIDSSLRNFPEIANDKEKLEFLNRQMQAIQAQQAEKYIHKAEFYERTNHPASAYFLYEIVNRRFPQTPYSEHATAQMKRLEGAIEKERQKAANPGFMESSQRWWNKMWGLESPHEKSYDPNLPTPAITNTPPAGDAPANTPPPKGLPPGMTDSR